MTISEAGDYNFESPVSGDLHSQRFPRSIANALTLGRKDYH